MQFILMLVLIIIFTKAFGHLSVKLGQPAVLGKLLAGIVLGPAILGWVHPDEWVSHFAEIGVLLLMFMAGLESDLKQLRDNWKSAFAVALGGIILPMLGGYGLAAAYGLSQTHALFIGLLLSATSVSISVQTLKELKQLNSREGTTILGAAVVDDVVVVVLMAVMMSLLGSEADISIPLLIGKEVLFFVVIIAAGLWLVPMFMKVAARFKVSEAIMSGALIVCLSFSYFAEWMEVTGIIGAFGAGIALAQTEYKDIIEQKVAPIANTLFIPVFFTSIGLSISLEGVQHQLVFIVLFSLLAIVTKWLGGGSGARLTGFTNRGSLAIGAGMISRGEVALIIATAGLASGLMSQEHYTAMVIVIIITTLVTPPILKIMFRNTK